MCTELSLDFRLRLWAHTFASRAICAAAELLVLQRQSIDTHLTDPTSFIQTFDRSVCYADRIPQDNFGGRIPIDDPERH